MPFSPFRLDLRKAQKRFRATGGNRRMSPVSSHALRVECRRYRGSCRQLQAGSAPPLLRAARPGPPCREARDRLLRATRLLEPLQLHQLAAQREVAVVHDEVAAHAVGVELEGNPVGRRFIALRGRVEIGDRSRPERLGLELRQRGLPPAASPFGSCIRPRTVVVRGASSASSDPSKMRDWYIVSPARAWRII